MEVTRPKFRETQVAVTSPETTAGPFGEQYQAAQGGQRQVQQVTQPEPEPYVQMVEE